MQRMAYLTRAAAVLLVAAAACACGGSAHRDRSVAATTAPAASSGPSQTQMAAAYQQIVAPTNAAIDTFQRRVNAAGASVPAAKLQKIIRPLVTALRTTDERLLRARWTPTVAGDIQTLVTADRQFEITLGAVGDGNAFDAAAWGAQVTHDEGSMSSAVSIVRAALGLPPAH